MTRFVPRIASVFCFSLFIGVVSHFELLAVVQDGTAKPTDEKAQGSIAGSWPQWRGPNRDNISPETGLLAEWPEGGPPLVWQVRGLGEGIAPVSVAGGKIYTVASQGQDEYVVALDEQTGNLAWTAKIGSDLPLQNRLMRWLSQRCPAVDGDRLYAFSSVGDLVCLQTATGNEVWRKNYPKEFGTGNRFWGMCDHPLVDGDKLICIPGGSEASAVALNKKTGDVLWQSSFPEIQLRNHGAFVISQGGGIRQYVGFLDNGLVGIAADNGRVLWRFDKTSSRIANTSTPIVAGDLIVSANGYGGGLAVLKLTAKEENVVTIEEQNLIARIEPFRGRRGRTDNRDLQNRPMTFDAFSDSTALVDGHLYATTSSGLPTCFEVPSGKLAWRARPSVGLGRIAFIYADGHLYCRFVDGTAMLVQATPEKYIEKGHFKIPDHVNSSGATFPVIAGGRLYLRDDNNLFCYDIRKGAFDAPRSKSRTVVLHPAPPTDDDDRFWQRVATKGVNRGPDAIWVPTPDDVVEKLLELAGLKKDSLVYDLGSGDGRVVIAAAKKYGAKAVGIEIDRELVNVSLAKVQENQLNDLVTIDRADMFKVDLSKADVVAVYLPPKLLERLRPQFEKMKPGSRLVSHYFELPGTPPDRSVSVESSETSEVHKVHVWTLPFKKPMEEP